jgi:phosphohistidine phosphatase SixA
MCYLLRTVSVFFLLALSACATADGPARLSQVFVMRHLQAESGEDPGLTEAGRRDSHLLAKWFKKSDRPGAIFVTHFRRSRETAAPLAAGLRIRPIVYDPSNNDALIDAVKANGGNVLIVGHSNTVPDIVERLGGARPGHIQHHEHGDIWRVSARGGEVRKLRLENIPPRGKRGD